MDLHFSSSFSVLICVHRLVQDQWMEGCRAFMRPTPFLKNFSSPNTVAGQLRCLTCFLFNRGQSGHGISYSIVYIIADWRFFVNGERGLDSVNVCVKYQFAYGKNNISTLFWREQSHDNAQHSVPKTSHRYDLHSVLSSIKDRMSQHRCHIDGNI